MRNSAFSFFFIIALLASFGTLAQENLVISKGGEEQLIPIKQVYALEIDDSGPLYGEIKETKPGHILFDYTVFTRVQKKVTKKNGKEKLVWTDEISDTTIWIRSDQVSRIYYDKTESLTYKQIRNRKIGMHSASGVFVVTSFYFGSGFTPVILGILPVALVGTGVYGLQRLVDPKKRINLRNKSLTVN
jgi:hypothetical protein